MRQFAELAFHDTPLGALSLRRLRSWLHPRGVFALWSDAAPDGAFLVRMGQVFARTEAEVVAFDNPLRDVEETCTIYRGWAD